MSLVSPLHYFFEKWGLTMKDFRKYPRKKQIFTYEVIGDILGMKSDTVMRMANKGKFDMADPVSICKFIISKLLEEEAKKT